MREYVIDLLVVAMTTIMFAVGTYLTLMHFGYVL